MTDILVDDVCVQYVVDRILAVEGEWPKLHGNREVRLTVVDNHDCHIEIRVRRVRDESNRRLSAYQLKEWKDD